MPNLVRLNPSPLTPFLGEWLRDPISVSRHKVSKRILGSDGLSKLWARGSMAELRECLAADPRLAENHAARLELGGEGRLTITLRSLEWHEPAAPGGEASNLTVQVARATAKGRQVIVRTGVGDAGYILRMKHDWLMVSETYAGFRPAKYPPSPLFRYHRAP